MIIGSLLIACTVGPDYVRPPTSMPSGFKEAAGSAVVPMDKKNWKVASPRDNEMGGAWWTLFHDPQLNELEEQLNRYNQTIVNALATYEQSRAVVDEARAGFFPTLSGTMTALRQKSGGGARASASSTASTVSQFGIANSSVSTSSITASLSALLNATWEPDFWGLVRRTVESDVAAAEANQALLAVTRLSSQGSLAQYYFELRALDTDQKLLNRTVLSYKKILRLTRNQYASGTVSQADVLQAESQLETTQAQAINNGILRAQYEHAIAVLIGRPPALVAIHFQPLNARPPLIPITVPSVWLERRPDVAQAERTMQQYNAQIGVAVAAFYPTLTLSGTISSTGGKLGRLVHSPVTAWSYGLQLAETIFDGGLRSATVRAARAAYTAQVATYRQTVLAAFQDVEDNLVNLRLLKAEEEKLRQAALASKKALRIVLNQYKAGTVPYSSVLTAQITAFVAEKSACDVAGLQMSAAVGLIKSLGGGWKDNFAVN